MRGFLGGAIGAVPGIALTPVLSFYALFLLVPVGVIAGMLVASAPPDRVIPTAVGAGIGIMVAVPFSLVGTHTALVLAPAIVLAAGIAGRHWGEDQRTPGRPATHH